MGAVHECGQRYVHEGLGSPSSSDVVREIVHKGGKHDNIYSAMDCGISIVVIVFIYYFRYLATQSNLYGGQII